MLLSGRPGNGLCETGGVIQAASTAGARMSTGGTSRSRARDSPEPGARRRTPPFVTAQRISSGEPGGELLIALGEQDDRLDQRDEGRDERPEEEEVQDPLSDLA